MITLTITPDSITKSGDGFIASHTAGQKLRVELPPEWEGLQVTLRFATTQQQIVVRLAGETVEIPAGVLGAAWLTLIVTASAYDDDGQGVGRPLSCDLGTIFPGVYTPGSGDEGGGAINFSIYATHEELDARIITRDDGDGTLFLADDGTYKPPIAVDLSGYVQRGELGAYALKTELPDLSPYALKTDIPAPVDLTGYARLSDIPPAPDLTPYAKKTDIPAAPDLSGYALKSELPDVSGFATRTELGSYALKTDVPDLAPYALKSEIPAPVDLSPYALKTDIPAAPDLTGYALKTDIITVTSGGGAMFLADDGTYKAKGRGLWNRIKVGVGNLFGKDWSGKNSGEQNNICLRTLQENFSADVATKSMVLCKKLGILPDNYDAAVTAFKNGDFTSGSF